MKKYFCCVLILVSLSFLLFSCVSEGENEFYFSPDSDGKIDLGGYTFRYLQNGAKDDGTLLTYKESTVTADAALKRINDICETYNIVYSEMFSSDLYGAIQMNVAAMNTDISAVQWTSYSTSAVGCARAGYFLPMSDVSEYIDYMNSEKWGDKYLLESLCWNNELYGVFPAAWPEYDLSICDFIFVINTDFVGELAADDPREYIEAGVWTRDKLTEIIREYSHYNNSNVWIYGLSANKYHFAASTAMTSGVDMVSRDANGVWSVTGLFSNTATDSFNWMRNIFYGEYADCLAPTSDGNTEEVMQVFADRGAVMTLMHSSFVFQTHAANNMSFAYQGIPFAILPFPNADISQYGNWITVHEMVKYGINIPVVTAEPEAAAFILNELYEPLEGFETKELIRDYYERNIFHDPRDADVFYKMMANNHQIYRADGMSGPLSNFAFDTKAKTVTEVAQSIETSVNNILNNYIIPTKESFNAVFGE